MVAYKALKNIIVYSEYLTHVNNNNSKILFYHDVNDDRIHPAYTNMSTSLDLFLSQIELVQKKGFEITPTITKPDGQVLLAFDDGWRGIYENKEFFLLNNIYPTICVAPGLLNHPGYLTDQHVKELYSLGFRFASHSWSHQSLTLFNGNEDSLKKEIYDSKMYIEDLLSSEVGIFCYPNGLFSKAVYESTLKYGYDEAWSVVDGDYYDEVMPAVKRRCLVQFANLKELELTLNGANRFFAMKHFKSTYIK